MPSDHELSDAIRIVKQAAQAEGFNLSMAEDLAALSQVAMQHSAQLCERAASIRAAVATIDEWRRECEASR